MTIAKTKPIHWRLVLARHTLLYLKRDITDSFRGFSYRHARLGSCRQKIAALIAYTRDQDGGTSKEYPLCVTTAWI